MRAENTADTSSLWSWISTGVQAVFSTDVSLLTSLPNYLLLQQEMLLYTGEERLNMVLLPELAASQFLLEWGDENRLPVFYLV